MNSRPLLDTLTSYFSHILTNYEHKPKKIYAVEYPGIKLDLPFTDFKREAGKVGRKDSIYDLDDGRLLLKVRTGVIFLQSEDYLVAVGPCESNPNQVINYTLNQYMTDLQRKDWTICHASSLEVSGVGIGIAAASGGGKSTLMLKLMELEEARFVTNDRLFMKEIDDVIEARGIAKLPRINPGTIINNDRLGNILTAEKKIELSKMSREELWCLEEKYDVDIEVLYGLEKIVHDTALKHLFILDWSLDSESPTKVSTADASDEDVLKAVMKSPGLFTRIQIVNFLKAKSYLRSQSTSKTYLK